MRLLGLLVLVVAAPAAAQDTVQLATLQREAVARDPRSGRAALERGVTELRLRSIGALRLPDFRLQGEASHQSEVAAIPVMLPGGSVPAPPKDRYEVAVHADWLFVDGGARSARRQAERARLETAQAELAAELHPLRAEVTESYFQALLLQERLAQLSVLVSDLEARLSEVRQHASAGAALPGDTAAVRAELLTAFQQRAELEADRRAALSTLRELTRREITGATVLVLPELAGEISAVPSMAGAGRETLRDHPRYAAFDARREQLEREAAIVRTRSRPQLSAFGQLAYGRPGFAQFTEDLHEYWLSGVRVRWAPWNWGTSNRDIEVLRIQRQIVDAEEAAFTARLARDIQPSLQAIARLEQSIELDEQIILLREQVERQARAQFTERAITAAAYVDARTDLEDSRIDLLRHRVELARAQARVLTLLGVELR